MTTAFLFAALFIFLVLGMPIAIALGLSSVLTILFFANDSLASLTLKFFEASQKDTLLAIPFFILAGRGERATLVLPRERRVLKDTGVAEVLERLTGLWLGAEDLRLIVSGCLADRATPEDGRKWGESWRAVTIGPERVAYLRIQNGRPVVTAADYGPWHIDYSAHASGFPRTVRVRRAGDAAIDITARIEQLQVNTPINPLAWSVEIPSDADPMTLDELRSIAPLAERK